MEMLERYRGSIIITLAVISIALLYWQRMSVASWLSGQIEFFRNTSTGELWAMLQNFYADPSLAPFTSLYMVIAIVILGLIFLTRP